jgi:hypothetical protein
MTAHSSALCSAAGHAPFGVSFLECTCDCHTPLMQCGCVATASHAMMPICLAHYGIHPGAARVAPERPSLKGRWAQCRDCRKFVKSNYRLAYFRLGDRFGGSTDSHYCGCSGWD